MSNFVASIEGPPINLTTLSPGEFGPAWDWTVKNQGLQVGGGANFIGWVSIGGSTAGGTGEVFQIQTSPDAINWATLTGVAMAATVGNQMCTKVAGADGVGACRKILRFIRVAYISTTGTKYTDGVLRWGVA